MQGQRGFGVLWAANTLSNLADGLAFVALPLLAASLTADPRLIAGLPLGYALVRLMFALPTGVWVDRLDRRRLLNAANMLRGLGFLALALGFQFTSPGLVSLYLAMAVIALLEGAADTAAMAILPQIVPTRDLDHANSKIAATQLVADEFAGPPLGGLLFAFAAAAPLYFMGGLWAVAGLLALALSPALKPAQMPGKPRRIWSEAGDGIRWLATHGVVGPLAVIGGLASIGYMLPFSVLVLFARENLGLGSTGYGLLLAFSALGGLVGTAITPKLRARWGYRKLISCSLALGALSLAVLASTNSPLLAGVMLALYILHAVIWNICAVSLRQSLIPDQLLGRVSAASKVVGFCGLAVGAAAGGLLGAVSLALPVLIGAGVFLLCTLFASATLEKASG